MALLKNRKPSAKASASALTRFSHCTEVLAGRLQVLGKNINRIFVFYVGS
jgi:hypothetical protein